MRPTAPAYIAHDEPADFEGAPQGFQGGAPAVVPVEVATRVVGCSWEHVELSGLAAGELLTGTSPQVYGAIAPFLESSFVVVRVEHMHGRIPLATCEMRVGRDHEIREGDVTVTQHYSAHAFLRVRARPETVQRIAEYAHGTLVPAAMDAAIVALSRVTQEDIDENLRS